MEKGYQIHRSPGQVHLRYAERVGNLGAIPRRGLGAHARFILVWGAFQRVIYADDVQASNIVAEFTKWHARPRMREITFRVKCE